MKNFCSLIAAFLIIQFASAQCGTAVVVTNSTCHFTCNGAITFTPSSGTSPYQLSVNGTAVASFASSYSMTFVCAGPYHYVLTDTISSCTDSGDVIVTEPPLLSISTSAAPATCGLANGEACALVIGGTPPYSYSWTPVLDTNQCASGLAPGVYLVAATDSNHCIISGAATIINAPGPNSVTLISTDVTCPGGSNGTVSVIPIGGTAPYLYSWLPLGGTGAVSTITNLPAGIYYLTVTDANGCQFTDSIMVNEPPAFLHTITATNATCINGNDGTACLTETGGTFPYNPFTWFPTGDTGTCVTGLTPGIHSVLITDANGCPDSTSVVITQSLLLSISSTTDVTCNGGSNGSACINATGGVSPYSYSLDGGTTLQTSNCFIGLAAGNYLATVTDTNGCSGTIVFSILQLPSIVVNAGPDLMVCNGSPIGPVCAIAGGGSLPYSYDWSTGPNDTTICISPSAQGVITVVVTDSNGCSATDNVMITIAPAVIISISSIAPSCGQCDGITTASSPGAIAYVWTPGLITTPFLNNACAGTSYVVTVTNAFGCFDTMSVFYPVLCDSVWPGDANLDGVADNYDVLSLGVNYGHAGPVRPAATNAWTGQVCANWADSLSTGVNGKHSDCDGNGTVDAADTVPVYLNYGLLHPRLTHPEHILSVPDLYLEANVDTAGPNQLLRVKVHMGSPVTPVPEVYGIAFTLTFDPTLVDTNTASFDYSTSVMGTLGVDLLSFYYPFYTDGAIDVAITRTNHANVMNIDSIITVFEVVITDNVSTLSRLQLGISNVKAIDYSQSPLILNITGDSVEIDPTLIGIQKINYEPPVSVFPAPASDYLKVNSPVEIENAELINELGEKILTRNIHQKTFTLDLTEIRNGMYILQLRTSSGVIRKKVCLQK